MAQYAKRQLSAVTIASGRLMLRAAKAVIPVVVQKTFSLGYIMVQFFLNLLFLF